MLLLLLMLLLLMLLLVTVAPQADVPHDKPNWALPSAVVLANTLCKSYHISNTIGFITKLITWYWTTLFTAQYVTLSFVWLHLIACNEAILTSARADVHPRSWFLHLNYVFSCL